MVEGIYIKMKKVLIWGIGSFYDQYLTKWITNAPVRVVAYVSNEVLGNIHWFDNKPVISPQEISEFEFDFIIVASNAWKEIKFEAVEKLHISPDKLINGKTIANPCFCWDRYMRIRESKITLITEACYGGYIYNQLSLPFFSPFINTRIEQGEYIRLLENLDYYLNQNIVEKISLDCEEKNGSITWGKNGYPIMQLGDISLHAIHAQNSEEYIEQWNRRKQRINRDNVFVLMILDSDTHAEQFSQLNIKNKVGFYYKETGFQDVYCMKEWNEYRFRLKWGHDFLSYIHHMIWDDKYMRSIDIFKLLDGEKDFLRIH